MHFIRSAFFLLASMAVAMPSTTNLTASGAFYPNPNIYKGPPTHRQSFYVPAEYLQPCCKPGADAPTHSMGDIHTLFQHTDGRWIATTINMLGPNARSWAVNPDAGMYGKPGGWQTYIEQTPLDEAILPPGFVHTWTPDFLN